MKRRLLLSTLLAAAFMVAPAFAQQEGGWFSGRGHMGEWFRGEMWRGMMGDGPGHMMMGRRFGVQRLEALKVELAITAAQEDAWKAYAKAVEASSEEMRKAQLSMMQNRGFKTLPERLDAQAAMMTSRLQAMNTVREATLTLYAKLDDAQKKKADDLILGMGMM